jgi:hypothetical protein
MSAQAHSSERICAPCGGAGCAECDHTGRRTTTLMMVDGVTVRAHGSAPLDERSAMALEAVTRAATIELAAQA